MELGDTLLRDTPSRVEPHLERPAIAAAAGQAMSNSTYRTVAEEEEGILAARICQQPVVGKSIIITCKSDLLAVQIQSLRLKEGWTQDFLAQKAGTKQAGVCRWENSQPPASLATLKKIASAFDVALVVKFVPFSEFLVGDGYPVDRVVASFTNDRLPSPTIIKAVVSPTRGRARTYTQHGRNVPPISRTMAAGTESRISR